MATQQGTLIDAPGIVPAERVIERSNALAVTDPIGLLQIALQKDAAIDVIERLVNLQREEREYQARVSFDEALSRCQSKLGRISTDAENRQTNSRYATYAKLDKAIRPIYTAEGFSISFGEKDCPYPGKTRFVAYLSRGGVTREYLKDMTPSTKGPKGQEFMTPIHADATADSYAKRYLLKDIFNVAIGEEDQDGNGATEQGGQLDNLNEHLDYIANARSPQELNRLATIARRAADDVKDNRSYVEIVIAENRKALDFCRSTDEIRQVAKPHFDKLRTLQHKDGMARITADVEAAKKKVSA